MRFLEIMGNLNVVKSIGVLAAVVSIVAGLSSLGILPRARNTAQSAAPAQATRSASATPPGQAGDASVPVASLPQGVSIVADDPAAQAQVSEASQDLAAILQVATKDYGLAPTRQMTVYLASDESTARSRLQQFGASQSVIDNFFQTKAPSFRYNTPNAFYLLIYLPATGTGTPMRGVLGLAVGDYAARAIGDGWGRVDAYPYWFLRGFELWTQTRFGSSPVTFKSKALSDSKAKTAPSLSSISTNAQAQALMAKPNGNSLLDDRSEAAVQYLAQQYGDAALGQLLKDNAFGSIPQFNAALQKATSLTPDGLDAAVDKWLQQ
jgi:hypothetical protein